MKTRNELQLSATKERMDEEQAQAKAVISKAEEENRERTEDEERQVAEHYATLKSLEKDADALRDQIKVDDDILGRVDGMQQAPENKGVTVDGLGSVEVKSAGRVFVDSAGYKDVQAKLKSGERSSYISTGAIAIEAKGTLLEGTGASPGTGGALAAPVPQMQPGVVDKLFQPLHVANLLGSGQATTNTLRYVVEGTATSGAAGVAEAGLKPESTVALSTTDEPVRKIATILPISEETLEDAAQVESYINGRLRFFVENEEERQLLRGAGTNELVGIIGRTNVAIYAGGTAAGTKAEQVFKAINGTRGSAFVEPEWIVMHPADWQDIRLAKDTANQYYGGGPFLGPYGGPQGPTPASGQLSGALDSLWNKPVHVTGNIGSGTALIGASSAATVYRRSGVSVEATNSHSDYFQRNLVAIRAEERLALAVFRPSAFCEVRLA